MDSLLAGGVEHASIVGQEFTATSVFAFVLENAAPPFQARLTRTGGGEITVSLAFMSVTGQTEVTDSTLASKDQAIVMAGAPSTPTTPTTPSLEVRFDVCAPSANAAVCFSPQDSGTFGVTFSGTLGDRFTSHLLSGATPSIYFLEGARDSVNAVFTRQTFTGEALLVQLYISGELRQTKSASRDAVIREDL